jgi:4-amino-4-deoxy-L-arabinose transferase-like glycosyltransferase
VTTSPTPSCWPAPALSYFDHPPLHQWLLAGFVWAFGEGRLDRLPFLALNLLTSAALFGLARRLFSSAAGWWTVFLFNACLYFLVLPEGYILPDQPLLLFLALGVWALGEILFRPAGRESWLWPLAGLAFGLAGLSKHSAAFAPLGLAGFLLVSPQHRRWLRDPRPYLAAALGLACFAPAVIWNAEHGWVSFAFQSGRAASRLTLDGAAWRKFADGVIAQIGLVTPWILWPIVAAMLRALRSPIGGPERFLLWLAAPPLIVFAAMPLLGERAIAHWFDSGWLFALPLAGAWLAARSEAFQRRFAAAAAALALIGVVVNIVAINFGGGLFPNAPDPGRHNREWPAAALREIYRRSGAEFALVDDWRTGGRLGVALGPDVAICGMGPNPRGYAYSCDIAAHLGHDALVVRQNSNGTSDEERAYFRELAPLGEQTVGPPGGHRVEIILRLGRELRTPPPLPYGP